MSDTPNPGTTPSDAAATPAAPAESAPPPASGDPSYAAPSSPNAVDQIAGDAIAADQDFSEHYRLLFASVGLFLAAVCMPIEGRWTNLYACHSIAGGFLTVFAGYGVLASWMNIHSRKMIIWPVFFAAADAFYVCGMRAMKLIQDIPAEKQQTMAARDWVNLFGSGFYVLLVMALMVIWTLLTAVMAGAKKDAARKEAAKASRSSSRK